jgi:hypothetical protein
MNEEEFGYRVRQALNEGADRLQYRAVVRLQEARLTALARQRASIERPLWVPALRFAGAGGGAGRPEEATPAWMWVRRLGLLAPLLVLTLGFVAIYRWHQDQTIAEHANMDLAVLLDDTPIDTYADKGFGVLIRNEQGI